MPDDDDVLQALDAINLTEQLRHDGVLYVAADAAPPRSEQRIHFVKEDDDGHTFGRLLTSPLEDETDVALRFANVLVQKFGPLMFRKKLFASLTPVFSATFLAKELATALAMRVLPHPGGPYSKIPFEGPELVLFEEFGVQ